MYTLHSMQRSGNSYKVRLLLAALNIPYELREVDILKGESHTPEFLAMNPAAQVPVLVDEDDAIVGLGAVMRGATYHFEVISNQSAAGLMRVANDTGVVVTNGIITVDTMDQALERAGSKLGNKGADAALAALATVTAIRSATA